jgi:hypothetical protein
MLRHSVSLSQGHLWCCIILHTFKMIGSCEGNMDITILRHVSRIYQCTLRNQIFRPCHHPPPVYESTCYPPLVYESTFYPMAMSTLKCRGWHVEYGECSPSKSKSGRSSSIGQSSFFKSGAFFNNNNNLEASSSISSISQ